MPIEIVQYPPDPEQTVREMASTPLHALRRKELERLLTFSGVAVKGGATQEFMILQAQEAMNAGTKLTHPPPGWRMPDQEKIVTDAGLEETIKEWDGAALRPVSSKEEPHSSLDRLHEVLTQPEPEKTPETTKRFEDMTMGELRRLVKARGLKQAARSTKADLIGMLHGQDAS